jgi:hypothetical protein
MIRLDPTAPGQVGHGVLAVRPHGSRSSRTAFRDESPEGNGSADVATWYNKLMVVQAARTEE